MFARVTYIIALLAVVLGVVHIAMGYSAVSLPEDEYRALLRRYAWDNAGEGMTRGVILLLGGLIAGTVAEIALSVRKLVTRG